MDGDSSKIRSEGFTPSPLARSLRESPDLLDEAVEAWHSSSDDSIPLHVFLGVSWEEYAWLMTPVDWVENQENYLGFMDYLVRNVERFSPGI